ncbi:MAG: EutN/CcmL family microcompartment protein [Halanaerobiales bacterium]
MKVCRVTGTVVSTNKCERLQGAKLLIVKELDLRNDELIGNPQIAVDTIGAGKGEVVMVVSGSSSRRTEYTDEKPVDLAIIAIIDSIEINNEIVFNKSEGGG